MISTHGRSSNLAYPLKEGRACSASLKRASMLCAKGMAVVKRDNRTVVLLLEDQLAYGTFDGTAAIFVACLHPALETWTGEETKPNATFRASDS